MRIGAESKGGVRGGGPRGTRCTGPAPECPNLRTVPLPLCRTVCRWRTRLHGVLGVGQEWEPRQGPLYRLSAVPCLTWPHGPRRGLAFFCFRGVMFGAVVAAFLWRQGPVSCRMAAAKGTGTRCFPARGGGRARSLYATAPPPPPPPGFESGAGSATNKCPWRKLSGAKGAIFFFHTVCLYSKYSKFCREFIFVLKQQEKILT